MTNVTILTDDNGVNREYREVKREANAGELVKVTRRDSAYYKFGDVGTVTRRHKNGHTRVEFEQTMRYLHLENYVVLEPTNVVHVDGVRYREEKREAKVGERILIVAAGYTRGVYENGDVLTVKETLLDGVNTKEHSRPIFHREYVVITPINEPIPNNITVNLTVNVASSSPSEILKAIADSVQAELAKFVGTPNNEETRDEITEALTNKSRDGIVEQAKADLVELRSDMTDVFNSKLRGRDDIYLLEGRLGTTAEFIVNKERRTVVCLLRGAVTPERVFARGIAKCSPDDCFNVHIGKAIALRRALGLDVPTDYLNAPQPTEARVGDVVVIVGKQFFHHYYDVGDIGHVKDISNPVGELKVYGKRTADANRSKDGYYQHVSVTDVEIIDDSRE